jgi:hypothetical protein
MPSHSSPTLCRRAGATRSAHAPHTRGSTSAAYAAQTCSSQNNHKQLTLIEGHHGLSRTWLRLAASSSARCGDRQPCLFAREIPYAIHLIRVPNLCWIRNTGNITGGSVSYQYELNPKTAVGHLLLLKYAESQRGSESFRRLHLGSQHLGP